MRPSVPTRRTIAPRATSRRLLPALVALVAALGVAAPAVGEGSTLRDPRGDVREGQVTGLWAPAPTVTNLDVLVTRVQHRRDVVTVWSRYADVARLGSYAGYTVDLRTPRGRVYETRVETSQGRWHGRARLFRGDALVRCRVRSTIDYARDTTRTTVPRRCLGTPRRVSARVDAAWATDDGIFRRDNPHSTWARNRGWTGWLSTGR